MPLDNAQFIAELSVTDPPGTDPLNQGDDHIRTTKLAVQQSFPLIDAAVPISAAQMAQMAIKNEANTFTLVNTFAAQPTFQSNILLDSGAASNSIFFDAGGVRAWQLLHQSAQFEIRRYVGGALIDAAFSILNSTGRAAFTQGINNFTGTTAAPAYSFTADTGMGMYRGGAGLLDFAVAGTFLFRVSAAAIVAKASFHGRDASRSAPTYAFENEINTGFYRSAGGTIAASSLGVDKLFIAAAAITSTVPYRAPDGTEALPGYAFTTQPDTGFFLSPININATVDGTTVWAMSGNGMFAGAGFAIHADGNLTDATKPGFSFGNDADTGFYRASANVAAIAAGGVSAMQIGNGGIFLVAGFVFQAIGENTPNKPAYTFSNDIDTGFYRIQANVAGIAAAGVQVMSFGTGGVGIRSGTPFFPNLPTSPGSGGSLWNNAGVVNVA